jgi:hypothetical protein
MRVHLSNLLKVFIFFIGLSPSIEGHTQTPTPPPGQPTPAATPLGVVTPPKIPQPQSAKSQEDWRAAMSLHPLPKKGCFTSTYPAVDWQEVPCGPPSQLPNLPAKGPRPRTVGGGAIGSNDFTAQVPPCNPPCHITAAIGSFDSVTGVTSLSGPRGANAFTLQMNTQFTANPPACSGIAGCQGWQQFVFSQTQCMGAPCLFIEYWLLNYGSSCPTTQWQSDGWNDCWFNSPTTAVPSQTIPDLGSLIMTATVGSEDEVILATTNGLFAQEQDSVLNLQQLSGSAWASTEYNIVGDCCTSEASFNPGSTIVVRLSMLYGSITPPACVPDSGTTGEYNNLNLVSTPASVSVGFWPSIVFTESYPGNSTPASCTTTLGRAFLTSTINYLLNGSFSLTPTINYLLN